MTAAPTSTAWYYDPEFRAQVTGRQLEIVEVLAGASRPLTLAEITREVNRRYHVSAPVADSSVSGRLNELLHDFVPPIVSDDNPHRVCSVTPKLKKTWRLLRPLRHGDGEQKPLFGGV